MCSIWRPDRNRNSSTTDASHLAQPGKFTSEQSRMCVFSLRRLKILATEKEVAPFLKNRLLLIHYGVYVSKHVISRGKT